MLIVGSTLALMAVAAYTAWFFLHKGRALWRERRAKKLMAAQEKAEVETAADPDR
jgi:flagellar basal body-associated protein FliL